MSGATIVGAGEAVAPAKTLAPIDERLVRDVPVSVEARLGSAQMTIEQLMALKAGAIVTLDTGLADHVDIHLNGACIARGEIVAVGESYGVRIVEVASER